MSFRETAASVFYPAAYHFGNVQKYAIGSIGFAYGSAAARYSLVSRASGKAALTTANRMASFYVRAHVNAVTGALTGRGPGILGTRLTNTAWSKTVGQVAGRVSGAATAGYLLGSIVGTGASALLFGESGSDKAFDLYRPGGASFLREGLYAIPDNAWAIASHYLESF